MKNLFEGTSMFVVSALGGAILALSGAKLAGMQTAMSLAPVIFTGIGLFVGAFSYLIGVFMDLRLSKTVIVALTLSFLSGLVGHHLMEYHYR